MCGSILELVVDYEEERGNNVDNLKKDSRVHLLDETSHFVTSKGLVTVFGRQSRVCVKHLEHSWHRALSI